MKSVIVEEKEEKKEEEEKGTRARTLITLVLRWLVKITIARRIAY